jgi:hypothetical protein
MQTHRRSPFAAVARLLTAGLLAGLAAGCAGRSAAPPQTPPQPPPSIAITADPAPPATASAEAPEPASGAEPVAAPAAGARTLCWTTQEEVTLVVGGSPPGARRVLRMTTHPADGTIEHQALRFDPNPQVRPRLSDVVWVVEGDRFTLRDDDGKLSGGGTLAGPAWAWTGWTADTSIPSGIRILEEAALGEDGTLTIDRRVFGPDGGAVMTLHEEGQPLGEEECAARIGEVAGG